MSIQHLWIAGALFWAGAAFGQAVPATAHADFVNAKGEKIGTATLTQVAGGVRVEIAIANLRPGRHALHIHTTGRCDVPDFMSAGKHFNPGGKQHGRDNPLGAHAGDLPNFDADSQGRGRATVTAMGVTLGEGANSLFHPGGTALMVHAAADDYKTDPTGNAGSRLACGVIQR
jgi:Cu-Zn family superoxide dismutase